jgi:long-chain fatty acid transport protein
VALLLLTAGAARAWAGGAYFYEIATPAEISIATAAPTARAQDAGTVFTNPAGMTRFKKPELLATGAAVYIYGNFNPDSKKTTIKGSDGQSSEVVPLGSVQYIYPVTPDLMLGVSGHNYFGLTLDWSAKWVGRYNSVSATLMAPQLQPTIAYKVNDWLSVGAGAGLTLGVLRDKARVVNAEPDKGDGKLRIRDTDFAVQGNFGLMLEPSENTRFGLRYLTKTNIKWKDKPRFGGLGPVLSAELDALGGGEQLELGINMPEVLSAGVFHQINDQWAVLGGVAWENWSQFGRVTVAVKDITPGNLTEELKFRDVWNFGIGAQYRHSPKWQYSAGFSYATNVATEATRSIELPIGTQYKYGLGLTYQMHKDLTLGAAAEFLYEGNLPVKEEKFFEADQLGGKYEKVSISVFSVYGKWTF